MKKNTTKPMNKTLVKSTNHSFKHTLVEPNITQIGLKSFRVRFTRVGKAYSEIFPNITQARAYKRTMLKNFSN